MRALRLAFVTPRRLEGVDHRVEALEVLRVERDADHLVVRRLLAGEARAPRRRGSTRGRVEAPGEHPLDLVLVEHARPASPIPSSRAITDLPCSRLCCLPSDADVVRGHALATLGRPAPRRSRRTTPRRDAPCAPDTIGRRRAGSRAPRASRAAYSKMVLPCAGASFKLIVGADGRQAPVAEVLLQRRRGRRGRCARARRRTSAGRRRSAPDGGAER